MLYFRQTFLGQKYGYRPFPPIINANQFEATQKQSGLVIINHLTFTPSTTLYTYKCNLYFRQTFLGQKYGYRPFPPIINANQFEAIQQALRNDGKEFSLLHTWFKKDENVLPPVYNLVPVSSILVHYGDKVCVTHAVLVQVQFFSTGCT